MLVHLVLMSLGLGVTSFLSGILPLSFAFSKTQIDRLSALGTGLLVGTALGVIIPEGIEAVVLVRSSRFPSSEIALSLLFGFTFMLVIEQLVSPHSHSLHHSQSSRADDLILQNLKSDSQSALSDIEFEAGLDDLEHEPAKDNNSHLKVKPPTSAESQTSTTTRAIPLTLGLVIHGIADGLALGASALARDETGGSSNLSLIVFFALMIHKAPTSLALTTSLLATSLSRTKCKKYLAIFSSATPIGAVGSYMLFSFFGNGDTGWTGGALLVSGGTFLYVATVLQSVSEHYASSVAVSEIRPVSRVLYIVLGMFVPFVLSALLGHGH